MPVFQPFKAPIVAPAQAVSLNCAPLCKRKTLVLFAFFGESVCFVCGYADINDRPAFLGVFVKGFQLVSSTPPTTTAAPRITVMKTVCATLDRLVKHFIQKGTVRGGVNSL